MTQTATLVACTISFVVAIRILRSHQEKDSPSSSLHPYEDGLRALCGVIAAVLVLIFFQILVAWTWSTSGTLQYGATAAVVLALAALTARVKPLGKIAHALVVLMSITPAVVAFFLAEASTKITPGLFVPIVNLAAAFACALYANSRIGVRLVWLRRNALLSRLLRSLVVGAGLGIAFVMLAPLVRDMYVSALASLSSITQAELASLAVVLALLAGAFGASKGRDIISPLFNDPASLAVALGALIVLWIGLSPPVKDASPANSVAAVILNSGVVLAIAMAVMLSAQKSHIWGLWSSKESLDPRRMTDPITQPSQDRLGRQHLALHLHARVERLFDAGGAILLSGPFGSGKSSVLNLLEHQFREDRSVRVLRIGVSSRKEGKEILAAVLADVADDLSVYVGSWSVRRMMKRYAEIFDLVPQVGEFRKTLAILYGSPSASEIRSQIEDDLQRVGLKYLIIIEDLDRLEGEVSTFVVRALIPLFRWKRTVVVVAADQEVLSEQVKFHSQETEESSNE